MMQYAHLFVRFQPRVYFWSIIMLARKFFITMVILSVFTDPVLQIMLALVLIVVSLVTHVMTEPFFVQICNALETFLLSISVLILAIALLMIRDPRGRTVTYLDTHPDIRLGMEITIVALVGIGILATLLVIIRVTYKLLRTKWSKSYRQNLLDRHRTARANMVLVAQDMVREDLTRFFIEDHQTWYLLPEGEHTLLTRAFDVLGQVWMDHEARKTRVMNIGGGLQERIRTATPSTVLLGPSGRPDPNTRSPSPMPNNESFAHYQLRRFNSSFMDADQGGLGGDKISLLHGEDDRSMSTTASSSSHSGSSSGSPRIPSPSLQTNARPGLGGANLVRPQPGIQLVPLPSSQENDSANPAGVSSMELPSKDSKSSLKLESPMSPGTPPDTAAPPETVHPADSAVDPTHSSSHSSALSSSTFPGPSFRLGGFF